MKRTAIVTGVSRGAGRAIAERLATDGAVVIAVARDADRLAALADRVAGIVPVVGDVRDPGVGDRAIVAALSATGRVDVLVNNAGIERVRPVDEVSDAEYDLTLDTNLRGTFNLVRAVLPAMKSQQAGSIVNIASTAGLRGFVDDAVYTASKFGVVGLTDALDEELRPYGIRVCAICPGAINTDLARDTWSPPDDPYRAHYLQPSDVADAVAWVIGQPPHVAVSRVVLRAMVEPPYGPLLPLP